jgi:hypothetical protein
LSVAKRGDIHAGPWEASTATPEQRAAGLRSYAKAACQQPRWDECEWALDEAKTMDPAGEGSTEVNALRGAIDNALKKSAPPAPSPEEAPRDIKVPRDIKP